VRADGAMNNIHSEADWRFGLFYDTMRNDKSKNKNGQSFKIRYGFKNI